MSSPIKTRSKTEVWLIGEPIDKIKTTKLPSNGDILRGIFFLTRTRKNLKESCNIVYSEIYQIWDKSKIPTREKQHVIAKMQKKYEEFRTLQKTKSRRDQTQLAKEMSLKDSLNDLFDIAHANALQMIHNEEDCTFLQGQREKDR